MPKLPDYSAPLDPAAVDTQGAAAAGSAGFQIERLGRMTAEDIASGATRLGKEAADQVDQHNAHMEVSGLMAAVAGKRNEVQQRYENYMADNPNDPQASYKFIQQVEPEIRAVTQDHVNTKEGQAAGLAMYRSVMGNLSNMAHADTMTRAGDLLQEHLGTVGLANSNTIYQSPTSYDEIQAMGKQQTDQLIATSGANEEARGKATLAATKTQTALNYHAAVYGAVDKGNYQFARDFIASHPTDVDPDVQSDLLEHIDKAQRAKDEATRATVKFNQEQHDRSIDAAGGQAITATVMGKDPNALNKFIANGGYKASELTSVINGLKAVSDPEAVKVDNPKVLAALQDRKQDGTLTNQWIMDHATGLKPSTVTREITFNTDYHNVFKDDPAGKLAVEAAYDKIAPPIQGIGHSPNGKGRMSSFFNEFIPQYEKLRNTDPKAAAEAIDTQNPKSLISQFIRQHQVSPAQLAQEYIDATSQQGVPGAAAKEPASRPEGMPANAKWNKAIGAYEDEDNLLYGPNGKPQ